MDIFKLVGSVFVETDEADKNLDNTQKKAEKTGTSFADVAKKAGKMAIGATTAAAAVVGGAIKMAKKTSDATDEIDKMSTRLGISRKAYQELDYVMGQAGVDVNSMQTGMKSLLKNMDAVTEGNDKAIERFEKLGVSVTDANGDMRSQEEVLYDVISAFQHMEDSSEKNRLAQELLGKQGQELLPLLNSEAGSFEDLSEKANELGLVLDDETIDAGVKMHDTFDNVQKTMASMATKIGAKVMPMVQSFLDWVMDHMPEIQAFFSKAGEIIGEAFDKISQVWNETLYPALKELWDFVKNTLWPIVKEAFEDYIGPTISAVFNSISTTWNNVLKPAFDAIKRALEVMQEKWEEVWDAIKDYVEPIIDWLDEKLGGLKGIIDGLKNALTGLGGLNNVMGTGKDLSDAAKGKIPGQAEGGYTTDPGFSWVGEHGPELMYMPKGATVLPLDKAPSIGNNERTNEILMMIMELLRNQKIEVDGREFGRMVRNYA